MTVDTTHEYSFAVDDEKYYDGYTYEEWFGEEDEEEGENYQEEEDSYDFPDNWTDEESPR